MSSSTEPDFFNFLLNQDESIWPDSDFKPYDFMDMDYINPSLLQYPHSAPLTFHVPSSPSDSSSTSSARRLSISSLSSSLSPAPDPVLSPAPDAASLIADRVRQSAGVMLALPITAQLQAYEIQQTDNTVPTSIPKLPIPRLPRHMSQSATNSAESTPPPTTPSPPPTAAPAPAPAPVSSPLSAAQPRSKTSHTTIERRYRTNLNARIQSLRMAVPALRVVDDRDGSKKRAPNKVLVSNDPLRSYTLGDDVVDERGFVDGVKVARKCSKANVLGKAVEYIRVLKRRELRLKNEQAGLKSLISGLVGGPALLREWEKEWKEMFGGEEKDEVDGEGEPEADDDDSEEEGDDDEEGGRKRKRGKTTPSSSPQVKSEKKEKKLVAAADGTVPEKRKRGRPRKVVPPPTASMEQVTQAPPPQQYLLATFALFSFFNSPLTSFSSPAPVHVHTGTVLNGNGSTRNWDTSYYLQLFHLLVSLLVLASCISNWAGIKLGRLPLVLGLGKPRSTHVTRTRTRVVQDDKNKNKGEDKEPRTRTDWIRLGESYVLSRTSSAPTLVDRLRVYYHISTRGRGRVTTSEVCTAALVLYGCPGPLGCFARARARAVWGSLEDQGDPQGEGGAVFERLVVEGMSVDEAVVRLAAAADVGVGVGVGVGVCDESELMREERRTPVRVLAEELVRERVRGHLAALFVASVRTESESESESHSSSEYDSHSEYTSDSEAEQELVERRRTIEAAKELGGAMDDLGRLLERLWKVQDVGGCVVRRAAAYDAEGEEEGVLQVQALVDAVVLFRRVFGARAYAPRRVVSALISPPPSPRRGSATGAGGGDSNSSSSNADVDVDVDLGRLRSALGCRVFEESAVLEDARDRAVDMVVELERRNVNARFV